MPTPERPDLSHFLRYLRKERTISELAERFGISERTAYRWMGYLREDGFRIVRDLGGWVCVG